MTNKFKSAAVAIGLGVGFLCLAAGFLANLWGRPKALRFIPSTDPQFTNTATVRVSAAELIAAGGDASGLDCYACHEKGKPPRIQLDANKHVVLAKEHEDLVMRHGRNNRNDDCYNCHDPEHLDMLKTKDGQLFKIADSTKLCASCHGPTYRDWEAGIHGRTSGYWRREMGAMVRVQCASCHHPHSPAFPSMAPAPRPHPLHSGKTD